MREIAEQLISYETAAGEQNFRATVPPAGRVLDAIRQPLCTLVGVQGCRSLFGRALALAKAKEPGLGKLAVQPDGSFTGFSELNAAELSAAGIVLTAQLLGLLATFIGNELTIRILAGVWPSLTVLKRGNGSEL